MHEYAELKQRLARGWNTWNMRSVLSHVLLPEGLALNLGIKEYGRRGCLQEALIGRKGDKEEQIHPAPRTYDDRYTELNLKWRGIEVIVQSAMDGDDLVLLVTPVAGQRKPAVLYVEAGMLWNRAGSVRRDGDVLVASLPENEVRAFAAKELVEEPYIWTQSPYLAMKLDGPAGVSTGRRRTVEEIQAIIARQKAEHQQYMQQFGELAETYSAVQTCMAWDTFYDPLFDRVISPVSRIWCYGYGGYVLFCWDTYFAALMAGIDNKDLAYANAIEITREKTESGFVPNLAAPDDFKSRDRSQPSVGAMTALTLYRKFGDRWLLEEMYDTLLEWNRWWIERRVTADGYLAWGSDPYPQSVNDGAPRDHEVDNWQAAAYESGLDNSPMFDDAPFNPTTHLMELADVGLMSLFIMDCKKLAEIADILGKPADAAELRERAETFSAKLQTLWDEEKGIFLNKHTDTGKLSPRLSPTNFYPLLAGVATQAQAERMMAEHFYNPEEFWGDWIMPTIARNDPGYPDQDYWRGRIWAPTNFLVYLGLMQYDLPQARQDMMEKSKALLLKEWRSHGHVHENYHGDTGDGCGQWNSDAFYHWGGLLGLIAFVEAGCYSQENTEKR